MFFQVTNNELLKIQIDPFTHSKKTTSRHRN